MSNPLNKSELDILRKSMFEVQKKQSAFDDRIDFILKTIYKNFDLEVDFWYFQNASDGEVGYLIPSIVSMPPIPGEDRSYIDSVYVETTSFNIIKFCINGQEVTWNGSKGVLIPLRWLFKDFEHEITIQRVVNQPLRPLVEKP